MGLVSMITGENSVTNPQIAININRMRIALRINGLMDNASDKMTNIAPIKPSAG